MTRRGNLQGAAWLALAAAWAACAGPAAAERRLSLIEGVVTDSRYVASPPCPEDQVCLDAIYDWRMKARTVAGPEAPSTLSARLQAHGPARNPVPILLLVERGRRGEPWWGWFVAVAWPDREACFERELLRKHRLAMPKPARRRGQKICVPV